MSDIRRRVRVIACAWLLCQVASLSAFVPQACCVSHAAAAEATEKDEACHEEAPQEGAMCPMHHGAPRHEGCAITNACDGPGAQLLTLFSYISTIDEPLAASTILDSTLAFAPSPPPLLHRLSIPDAPPPKA